MRLEIRTRWLPMLLALILTFGTMTRAVSAEDGVAVDETNFPDTIFRAYITENADTDGDGVLSVSECLAVTKIDVNELGVASVQGLEFFPNLQTLDVALNELTELDVTNNTELVTLKCSVNQISILDVSRNKKLETLWCEENNLSSIDVSNNKALSNLIVKENDLSELDVTQNAALRDLDAGSNNLSELDVTHNPNLESLDCEYNQLTTIDVTQNPKLTRLGICNNQLTSLDVSRNPELTFLTANTNRYHSLDLSNNKKLGWYRIHANKYTLTINTEALTYDLRLLDGFNPANASNWTGAAVFDGTLMVEPGATEVTYRYDCGSGISEVFTFLIEYEDAHSYETKVNPATPTSDGTIIEQCTGCGHIASTTRIPKVSQIKLSTTTYTYNAKVKTPSVTVKDAEGNTLTNGIDYTVSVPGNRKNVGTFTYKIALTGEKYSGSASRSFRINPAATKITKLSRAKKAFTVKWTKKTAQTTGYQVQYSTSKKFTKSTTKAVTVKGAKSTSKKVNKLKRRKKYYVRVRTYKTVGGKNYYSAWSAVRSVRTK